jgi:3-methylcrotonyl-CoA carboxylase alpha subunit
MIAKLITWGTDRPEAIRRMQGALAETEVIGVKTNLAFLQTLVRHAAFLAGDTDTAFIAKHKVALLAKTEVTDFILAAACAQVIVDEASASTADDVWDDRSGWRLNQTASRLVEFIAPQSSQTGGQEIACHVQFADGRCHFVRDHQSSTFAWTQHETGAFHVRLNGAGAHRRRPAVARDLRPFLLCG